MDNMQYWSFGVVLCFREVAVLRTAVTPTGRPGRSAARARQSADTRYDLRGAFRWFFISARLQSANRL